MFEIFLIHAVFEYLLQPEPMLTNKREPKFKGFLYLIGHVALPTAICGGLGLVDFPQIIALLALHLLADGPFGRAFVRLLPGQSVGRLMSSKEHEEWPMQVQALQFGLVASSEKMTWATLHALAIYGAVTLPALIIG